MVTEEQGHVPSAPTCARGGDIASLAMILVCASAIAAVQVVNIGAYAVHMLRGGWDCPLIEGVRRRMADASVDRALDE